METNAQVDGSGNIIIQNVDGSTIIVNQNDAEGIKQLVINLGDRMSRLPQEILQLINEKQDVQMTVDKGANLYLTTLIETSGYGLVGGSVMIGVTITNLTKEIRYFNQPFFKVNPSFILEPGLRHDTFALLNEKYKIKFPCRLEYGEPVSVAYPINPNSIGNYERIYEEDKKAHIQCFTSTTVGELYESNQYEVVNFLQTLKAIRK
ncbi:MAG: hypothetical protein ACRYFX_23555 [Janthinobacterium lividum]